jgi:hypothetical protein
MGPPHGNHRVSLDDISGYVIEGDLTIDGNLINGEQDFGPVLVVLGVLKAHNVAIAGAPLIITRDLKVTEMFHGYYNHGSTVVFGRTTAEVFVASDYFHQLEGALQPEVFADGHAKKAVTLSTKQCADLLVTAAIEENPDYDHDAPGDEPRFVIDDGKVFALLEPGKPVLQSGKKTTPVA